MNLDFGRNHPPAGRSIASEPGLSLSDTNATRMFLRRLTRSQSDPRVAQWLEDTDDDLMHISVITIGEIAKGRGTLHMIDYKHLHGSCDTPTSAQAARVAP
jgi:hypothetical protein